MPVLLPADEQFDFLTPPVQKLCVPEVREAIPERVKQLSSERLLDVVRRHHFHKHVVVVAALQCTECLRSDEHHDGDRVVSGMAFIDLIDAGRYASCCFRARIGGPRMWCDGWSYHTPACLRGTLAGGERGDHQFPPFAERRLRAALWSSLSRRRTCIPWREVHPHQREQDGEEHE